MFRENGNNREEKLAYTYTSYLVDIWASIFILGDIEVTANTYCKSSNLPNTDTQNYSTDLR